MDHEAAVDAAPDVQLDPVGTQPPGLRERLDRVLPGHAACPSVGQDENHEEDFLRFS
jgi:hypothetical protein